MTPKLLILEIPIEYDRSKAEELYGKHFKNMAELFKEVDFNNTAYWTLEEYADNLNYGIYPTGKWVSYVYIDEY